MTNCPIVAQRADGSKLSAWVHQKVQSYQKLTHRTANLQPQMLTAFVKTTNEQVLEDYGCKIYAQLGDICIATIPLTSITDMSQHPAILRIEASPSADITLDSVAKVVNVLPAYEAKSHMPFTGKGVVVGLMDVGFDLTHPTFYNDQTLSTYRIKRFWDQLSPSIDDNPLPVGREYVTQEEILAKSYATDGLTQNHGSHTAGTAAGSGYDSPFRGVAYESDICLVANAITADTIYIDPKDYEKYTPIVMRYKFAPVHSIEPQIYKAAELAKLEEYHAVAYPTEGSWVDQFLNKDDKNKGSYLDSKFQAELKVLLGDLYEPLMEVRRSVEDGATIQARMLDDVRVK